MIKTIIYEALGATPLTITKVYLKNLICIRFGFTQCQASRHVEFLLEYFKKTLASGENILISGFGKFIVKEKNERGGKHSQTENALPPHGSRVVTFRCSPVLKKKLNGGRKSSSQAKPTYP